jgi:hypothetical protein
LDIWSVITPELVLKSLVSGTIGSIDSVILVFVYRFHLSSGRFYLIWAGLTAFIHFIMKFIAGTLSSIPDNLNLIVISSIRIVALLLSAWVVHTSWQEIKHLPSHIREQSNEVPPDKKWSLEQAQLWVPAILIGGLDAYPIGTIKGLLLARPDLLKTIISSFLGSFVVGGITFVAALLVRRIERQLSPFHVSTLIVGRVLHVSVFVGITLALSIEWYYVLVKSNYTPLHVWISPFIAAFLVSILLFVTHGSKWQSLIKNTAQTNKTKTDQL